jgi:hypothetical protein
MASPEADVTLACTLACDHGIYHMTGSLSGLKINDWHGLEEVNNRARHEQMSTTYWQEDVTDDQEPDPEQQRRDMIVNTLGEYRLNVMAVSEMLAMCSAYLSQDLESRPTDELEAMYAQLVGNESQEVH